MTTRAPSPRPDGKITRTVLFTLEQYEPIADVLGDADFSPFARAGLSGLAAAIEDYAAKHSGGDPRLHAFHVDVARAHINAGAFTISFDTQGGAA